MDNLIYIKIKNEIKNSLLKNKIYERLALVTIYDYNTIEKVGKELKDMKVLENFLSVCTKCNLSPLEVAVIKKYNVPN